MRLRDWQCRRSARGSPWRTDAIAPRGVRYGRIRGRPRRRRSANDQDDEIERASKPAMVPLHARSQTEEENEGECCSFTTVPAITRWYRPEHALTRALRFVLPYRRLGAGSHTQSYQQYGQPVASHRRCPRPGWPCGRSRRRAPRTDSGHSIDLLLIGGRAR